MSAINKLLDKAQERCSPANQSGLALKLGVTRGAISSWKTQAYPLPTERIAEIARIAHVDPGEWVLLIEEEQAKGEAKKAYASLLKRLGIAASVFLLVGAMPLPGHAARAQSDTGGWAELRVNPLHCLLCHLHNLARFLLAWWNTPAPTRNSHGRVLVLQG